ncbi:MAG: arylsulfatase [Planctomycetaceae bacterium]
MQSNFKRLIVLFFISITGGIGSLRADERPNVIYILADDAGYGDFGCYGGQQLRTPQVDRMAREGMRLTRHYAGCTVCAPSRCVLMTGLHTGHCQVRGNSPGQLRPEDVTLPGLLQASGYQTICVGKWGLGAPLPLTDPNDHGFDEFYGYVSMWHAHNFFPEFLIRNGRKEPLRNISQAQWRDEDGRGVAETRLDYAPELLTQEVLNFLRQPHQKPFFLYYALNVPHANNEGGRHNPGPEKGMEVPDLSEFADRDWPGPEKGFAAIMKNLDRDVGRILETVDECGLSKNTIIMFSSDNGPHQEGGHVMEFFNSNGDLRGMKRDLYEGGIRVPLIVRWKDRIPAGTQSDHISGFQDVLPTVLDFAGLPVPDGIDGISMKAELLRDGVQQQHDYLYWEFSEQKGKRALLKGNWKLIQRDVATNQPAAFELYDVDRDLSETNSVAEQFPQIVHELSELLEAAHRPSRSYPLFPSEQ